MDSLSFKAAAYTLAVLPVRSGIRSRILGSASNVPVRRAKPLTLANFASRTAILSLVGMIASVIVTAQAPQQPPGGPPGRGAEGRGPEGAGRGRGGRGPLGGAAAGFVLNPEIDKTPP